MTEGPGKEHETNKAPPTLNNLGMAKRRCQSIYTASLPESSLLESILAEQ